MVQFKELTGKRDLKTGTYLGEFATTGIGRLLAAAGTQFVFVDMEHSGFGFETAASLLRRLHDAGIATILRPPSQRPDHLARACDIGAQGICPPMLGSAEQAMDVLDAIKYPPVGKRGCAFGIAHDDYLSMPVSDAISKANEKISLVALIETAEGAENCEAIAALDGVDCVWVGHFDLSASLGIAGQFDHPDFRKAVTRVMAAARNSGKSVGRMAGSGEEAGRLFAEGCDFICYMGDIWLFAKALRDGYADIRSIVGDTALAGEK